MKLPYSIGNYETDLKRLKHMATEFQYVADDATVIPRFIVDCAYNHHIHTNSCFKTKTCQDATALISGERRYRYPQGPKQCCTVEVAINETFQWFK
jgi:hypothetical protein